MKVTAEEVYNVIRQHIEKEGYPPARIEIAECLGVSRSTAQRYCKILREQGRVTWTFNVPRSIRITDHGGIQ